MKSKGIIIALLLCVVTFATFSPVLTADFVPWDDNLNITGNPHIQKLEAETLRWMLTDTSLMRRYVPLAWLNWAVLHHFFGLSPRAFHAEALLLHVINTVFVFLLIRRVLRKSFPQPDQRSHWIDAATVPGVLLWAIHPLRAETVGWANCVIYPLSLCFALCSVFFYLRSVERPDKSPIRTGTFWAAVFFFACSLLTYPTALAFIVVLLVLDVFLLRRVDAGRVLQKSPTRIAVRLLAEKIPFVLLTLAVAGVTLWARANMSGIWAGTSRIAEFGWAERGAQAFYIWTYFLWKPFWPVDLAPVYTDLISVNPVEWRFLGSVAIVVAVSFVAVVLRQRCPILLAVWICHLTLLVPMLGLTEHPHYPNDRYNYLSSVAWSVLISAGLLKIWQAGWHFRGTAALTGATAVVLGLWSFQQTQIWRDGETLFTSTISRLGNDPYRCDLYWRLGLVYAQQNKDDAALRALREAVKLANGSPRIRNDLAALLVRQGRIPEAVSEYREVLRVDPTNAMAHRNLAIVLAGQGDRAEAVSHYEASLRSDPDDVQARVNFASLLAQLGRSDEAAAHVEAALKLNPRSAEAHVCAGKLAAERKEITQALSHFKTALSVNPDHPEAHHSLGLILAQTGTIAAALPHFRRVAQLQPNFPDGHLACAMALAQLGHADAANQSFEKALAIANTTGRHDLVAQIETQLRENAKSLSHHKSGDER